MLFYLCTMPAISEYNLLLWFAKISFFLHELNNYICHKAKQLLASQLLSYFIALFDHLYFYSGICLTLSNIRYVSSVKWSNPGKGVAPSPTPRCSSYWKGSFRIALDYARQPFTLLDKENIKKEYSWDASTTILHRSIFIPLSRPQKSKPNTMAAIWEQ